MFTKLYITLNQIKEAISIGEFKSMNATDDLNIFQSIETSANTGGVEAYWYGVVEVVLNNEIQPPYYGNYILFDGEGKRK